MARPTKSVNVISKKLSKEEINKRTANEKKLRGYNDKIKPAKYLTTKQKKIFKFIVEELKASELLGNVDIFILEKAAISVDRLQEIEELINNDSKEMYNKELIKARSEYTKDFFRCCNELSLSPQSRAKIANNTKTESQREENPILKLVKGGQVG